jgi:hypothetical protein
VIGGCNRNYYATILYFFVLEVMAACDLWIADFLWGNKRIFGGYGWPAGYNLSWRVWVWGNSPTCNQIWGYPRYHIVIMGMDLESPYPMGIYPLPSWPAVIPRLFQEFLLLSFRGTRSSARFSGSWLRSRATVGLSVCHIPCRRLRLSRLAVAIGAIYMYDVLPVRVCEVFGVFLVSFTFVFGICCLYLILFRYHYGQLVVTDVEVRIQASWDFFVSHVLGMSMVIHKGVVRCCYVVWLY